MEQSLQAALSLHLAGYTLENAAEGIRLALDDFGSGFASVGYLRQLHFDRLKIDKQFLRDATDGTSSAEMLVAIVALGRALRLEITAEGVETAEQMRDVRSGGCAVGQGYHIGRPMPASDMARFLAEWTKGPIAASQPPSPEPSR